MRRVKIEIEELISILEQMQESGGTQAIIIFDHEGLPAICDVEEPDNIIAFAPDPDEFDDESLH